MARSSLPLLVLALAATSAPADDASWAYRAPEASPPPAVADARWPRGDIDRFVLAGLERHGLAPSPDAGPNVLLRRIHFALGGLPPTPADLDRFAARAEADGLDIALEREVDSLLASPAFGERWGRHWLDVARFGESSGKEANVSFPHAWRYRDYVIDAVNADLPYDRFLTEQVAGDLLPSDNEAERARLLIATGFLAVGPKNLDAVNPLQFRADLIDEQIDALTRAVMGSSVACARCHDHKSDPFTMRDYYALAGIFGSTRTYFGTAVSPVNRVAGDPLPLPRLQGQPIFHRSMPAERVAALKAELEALREEERQRRTAAFAAAVAGKDPGEVFSITDALRIFWRSGAIEGELKKVDDDGRALPLAMGVTEGRRAADARLLERGEIDRPGESVPRGFPAAIRLDGFDPPSEGSGRLELARWLTHPRHPLTARVFVNRAWHHLFGAGLVRTVDHFATDGERPSHPELLDHLAVRFVEDGWSLKRLVREIVLSRAFRQASDYDEASFRADPDNRLLWRATKRRLEAEAIRDAMLSAAGEVDRARPSGSLVATTVGDRPIALIGLDRRLPPDLDGSRHRSVYLPVIRDRLPDVLELFDFAEPSLVTGARDTTNVPTQALYLLNGPFVRQRAVALAGRLSREAADDAERVRLAFRLCFGREPEHSEEARSVAYLNQEGAGRSARVNFCQALLCVAEFRNLD